VDDASIEPDVPDEELEAVRLQLAGLGQEPLPGDVAARLDARLAAELSETPLAARRQRRRQLRIGASLSAAAAVAAAVVFALSSGGGGHPAPEAAALPSTVPPSAQVADSAATTAVAAKAAAGAASVAPARKHCPPASRTAGDRPRAGCPGARGGHARAV
jgi:hypothetical protein